MISTTSERRHPRIEAPTVHLQIATREKFRRRFLRDLSQGGVYIRTQNVEPVGSEVRLELLPPGWELPLRIRGEVVRVAIADDDASGPTAVGMGVQFKEVGPKNRELLAELLSEYQSNAPRFEDDDELPDDHAELKRELRALRNQLREARILIASLCSDIEAMEDYGDTSPPTSEDPTPQKPRTWKLGTALDPSANNGETLQELLHISEVEKVQLGERLRLAEVRAIQTEQDFLELRRRLQQLVEEAHESAKIEIQNALGQAQQRNNELADHLGRAEEALKQAKATETELHRVLARGSSRAETIKPLGSC